MQIRKATDKDIPQIVSLLKTSLGEAVPINEDYWNWKHRDNPFGKSYILLAEENNQLIGVRAFMYWKWQDKDRQYTAVRAVDTATHPDYRGKGIFTKLTLSALEEVKINANFVYNTPNEKSIPGYLKMGWIKQGRISVKMNVNPLACRKKVPVILPVDWNSLDFSVFTKPTFQKIQTIYSPDYLKWRYIDNPVIQYDYLTNGESFLLIYRYKPHSFGAELRITDVFILPEKFSVCAKKELERQLKLKIKQVFLTTVSYKQYLTFNGLFPHLGIFPPLKKGPIVTLKNLNLDMESFHKVERIDEWASSFGDMELF
jgi:N-acetylglutamate synthase-like GNAT family acetyltransferase